MKGSEYLAARAAITVAGLVVGGSVVAVTALWVMPWIMQGLAALMPNVLPPLGGIIAGLAAVWFVAVFLGRIVGYYLVKFERWTIDQGGIED